MVNYKIGDHIIVNYKCNHNIGMKGIVTGFHRLGHIQILYEDGTTTINGLGIEMIDHDKSHAFDQWMKAELSGKDHD